MKVNVTCAGCEVTVEEIDGKCVIVAMQDGEVVEEFSIDCEGTDEEEIDEIDVDENDIDEEDFDEEDFDEEDEVNEGVKSFNKFFTPKSKKRSKSTRRKSSRR